MYIYVAYLTGESRSLVSDCSSLVARFDAFESESRHLQVCPPSLAIQILVDFVNLFRDPLIGLHCRGGGYMG